MRGKVYGVSLGPGDPDLVTVKALKTLAQADKVYYPGTMTKSGGANSFALEILLTHGIPQEKLKSILVTMSMPWEEVDNVYDDTVKSIMQDLENGLHVAVVCIGDAGFYSTFGHLHERMKSASIDVEIIAGVPAFIAAGASAHVPLALRSDKVLVLPGLEDVNELDKYLDLYETVVVMKLSMIGEGLYTYLEKREKCFVYVEYLGTSREFVSRCPEDLRSRRIPYFSLMILFNNDRYPVDLCLER